MFLQNPSHVKLTKVKHICQDPDDLTLFGITIATIESPTRYRMYAFKTEESVVSDCAGVIMHKTGLHSTSSQNAGYRFCHVC